MFNEAAEKSTAAADEANYGTSDESEGFWDELGADDDDIDAACQPELLARDENQPARPND